MELSLPPAQLQQWEVFLHQHFDRLLAPPQAPKDSYNKGHLQLMESVGYSLFSGGKRFRPSLGFLLGEALNLSNTELNPYLAAVECIHTYSLIHDDLPCMDNDSLRRGKPTNHILFGETTALLAGDALLTEAFSIIAQYYFEKPLIGLSLVHILSRASGLQGMVSGQALDLSLNLSADLSLLTSTSVQWIHQLKTGALIRSVAEGVAVLAELPTEKKEKITQFGSLLGYAFQLKDDLLDYDAQNPDPKNLTVHLGLDKTVELLTTISEQAQVQLQVFKEIPQCQASSIEPLSQLIQYNQNRIH